MANKSPTIIVFGASSNIGRKFIEVAVTKNINIIAVVRDIQKISFHLPKTNINVQILKADITNRKQIRQIIRNHPADVTINFAVNSSNSLAKAKKVNVSGEQNIIEESIKSGIKRHIYISSIATLMSDSTTYRDTKLAAEEIVKSIKSKKMSWIILRYGHVLGTPTWDQPFKFILPFFRIGIPVVPTDTKKASFPFASIDTVIDATISAIEAKPNQTITVIDNPTNLGEYLKVMEEIYHVRWSFFPFRLIRILSKLLGEYLPQINRYLVITKFLSNPPILERSTMNKELKIKPRNFSSWAKRYYRYD